MLTKRHQLLVTLIVEVDEIGLDAPLICSVLIMD